MTDRILRLPEVEELTGLRRTAIYAHAKSGSFPQPFKITKRATGWLESEVRAWIESRASERERASAA